MVYSNFNDIYDLDINLTCLSGKHLRIRVKFGTLFIEISLLSIFVMSIRPVLVCEVN